MSDPILPLAVWEEGTLQNDVPANDNSLRLEALSREVVGTEDSPTSSNDGDVFIVGGAPSGTFATFDPDDLTIYRGGNWHAWAPLDGIVVNVAGSLFAYSGSSGWAGIGGGALPATTDDLPEGTVNLYFTTAHMAAATHAATNK